LDIENYVFTAIEGTKGERGTEQIGKMRDKLDAMLTNLLKVKPGRAVR
jgi:hypothetical protein